MTSGDFGTNPIFEWWFFYPSVYLPMFLSVGLPNTHITPSSNPKWVRRANRSLWSRLSSDCDDQGPILIMYQEADAKLNVNDNTACKSKLCRHWRLCTPIYGWCRTLTEIWNIPWVASDDIHIFKRFSMNYKREWNGPWRFVLARVVVSITLTP